MWLNNRKKSNRLDYFYLRGMSQKDLFPLNNGNICIMMLVLFMFHNWFQPGGPRRTDMFLSLKCKCEMSVCERIRGFKVKVRFCSDEQTSQPESQQPEQDGELKKREQQQILSPPAQISQREKVDGGNLPLLLISNISSLLNSLI